MFRFRDYCRGSLARTAATLKALPILYTSVVHRGPSEEKSGPDFSIGYENPARFQSSLAAPFLSVEIA